MYPDEYDIPTLELSEELKNLPRRGIKRVLLIRSAPEKLVLRGVNSLRQWKAGLEITVLCHKGGEIEGCEAVIYPHEGFFRLERIDLEILQAARFDLVVVPYATSRRLSPSYHNVDRIAGALGNKVRILFLYEDGTALAADNRFLEFKQRTVVEPFMVRKKEAFEEIAAYTDESLEKVEGKCDLAGITATAAWVETSPGTEEAVQRFYQDHDFYIYELMKTEYNGDSDSMVEAVLGECSAGEKVLDYGGGCGTYSIALAQAGALVTHLDLEGPLLEFVRYRFRRRNLPAKFIGSGGWLPLTESYDCILSVFVVEHLANPERIIGHMAAHLNPGGKLLIAVDWEESEVKDEPLPFHLDSLSRSRYGELMDELGMVRLKTIGELEVFSRA